MFGWKKKYNNKVSELLPVLGINLDNAESDRRKLLNIAREEGYSVHEAALFVAYNFLGYLGKECSIKAALEYLEIIQPIEKQWVTERLVNERYPRKWHVAVDETLDGALSHGMILGRIELTPNMPDVEGSMDNIVLRGNLGRDGGYKFFIAADVKSGIESMGFPSLISYPLAAFYFDAKSRILLIIVTLEIGPPNVPMLCMFSPGGHHENFGEQPNLTDPREFAEKANDLFKQFVKQRYDKALQEEIDRLS